MSLDVVAASKEVTRMAGDLVAQVERMRPVPGFAADLLRYWHDHAEEAQDYLEGLEQGGVWPFAVPVEALLTTGMACSEPATYTVLATDGSQIDVDSHGLVHCFLVNVGWAAISYGAKPDAWLASRPQVHYQDEDLFMPEEDGANQELGEHLLSLVRTVAELERLSELAEEWRDRPGLLAVADGNLIRWEFGGKRPDPARAILLRRFTAALARFRALGVPICSYISRPNAREVANTAALLAVRDCDRGAGHCARCSGRREPLCTLLRVLNDRALLTHLAPGERSGLFRSLAPVLQHYAPQDRMLFFYQQMRAEMARIELPIWAATPETLAHIQGVLSGQCARGHGYPVVLMEAHEQAVIHGASREAFRHLVMEALQTRQLEVAVSAKRLSKEQRSV